MELTEPPSNPLSFAAGLDGEPAPHRHVSNCEMTGYTKIKKQIEKYSKSYRRASFPSLQIGELYDLFPELGNMKKQAKLKWPDEWPLSENKGVYIFLDDDLNILYIGKASMNSSLGSRLSVYCRYNKKTKNSGDIILNY